MNLSQPAVALYYLFFPLAFGFVITVLITVPLIGWLRERQLGKTIRSDGPDHQAKAGTPTMGGIGMLVAVIVPAAWMARTYGLQPDGEGLAKSGYLLGLVVVATLVFAALGLLDDRQGLARKRGSTVGIGLSARQMLAWQGLAGLTLGWLATRSEVPTWMGLSTAPTWLVIILFAFVIVGTVNGVNLSDGLDGLASGSIALASATFGLIGLIVEGRLQDRYPINEVSWLLSEGAIPFTSTLTGMIALALAGASLGFLVFNRHPAKVFMGNVASMGLGGALAMLFIVSGLWWLLPIVGAVFVAEVVSDLIQIGYFKWSGGKRIFRMAPLHHHFELGGMHETTVVRRFWLAGLIAGLVGIAVAVYAIDRIPLPIG